MKAFLEYVLKNLVDAPDSVSVQQVLHSGKTILEVRVLPGDMGKVVGKQGQTIAAIRSVMSAAASRYGGKVDVEIIENHPRPHATNSNPESSSSGSSAETVPE